MAETKREQGKFYWEADTLAAIQNVSIGDRSRFINQALREFTAKQEHQHSLPTRQSQVAMISDLGDVIGVVDRLPTRTVIERTYANNRLWVESDQRMPEDQVRALFVCETQADIRELGYALHNFISFAITIEGSGLWFSADPAYAISALPQAVMDIDTKTLLVIRKALARASVRAAAFSKKAYMMRNSETSDHFAHQSEQMLQLEKALGQGTKIVPWSTEYALVSQALNAAETSARNEGNLREAAEFGSVRLLFRLP